jgi:hypothetical protein
MKPTTRAFMYGASATALVVVLFVMWLWAMLTRY